ncbi:MAG TPA: hypothetical protein VLS51_06815, partial [Propionibacteriaceae bacterium]|nr:hypothetical protein [Propionibacteriaceae bacterium]
MIDRRAMGVGAGSRITHTSWRARADDAAGRLLESLIRTHHRRRMARNGSSSVLDLDPDSATATDGSPLRHGNSVEILVDGNAAFSSMLDTIRGARHSVHIAGWHAMPDFALTRGNDSVTLGNALRDAATRAQVRVLMWGGAQLPVIHPTRSDAREARDGFDKIPGVVAALDHREYLQHCHHEKLVVVDGEVAYVGGLD